MPGGRSRAQSRGDLAARRPTSDFCTIADFRRANRAAFKPLFRAFVLLCRKLALFGRELVALDGTRLKAVNSRKHNFTRQKLAGWITLADGRIEEYLERLDLADRAEVEAEGAARRAARLEAKLMRVRERHELHHAMLAELVASGESQLSLTDPDTRGMKPRYVIAFQGNGVTERLVIDAKQAGIRVVDRRGPLGTPRLPRTLSATARSPELRLSRWHVSGRARV